MHPFIYFQRVTDPFHIVVQSDVPTGAGLSSSAALEVACAIALGGAALSKMDLIRACLRAENNFVGLPCGIMDQYISVAARAGCALKINCATQQAEAVPLPADVSIIAVNSMVKHELGKSEYPVRVADCKARVPKRWRHVESENQRVLDFVAASARGDLDRMGELFAASHRSLQHDYEVSCAEIDFLVDTAIALPYVYGARITGGGFGGCTVNLVRPGHEAEFESAMSSAYRQAYAKDPAFYRCVPSGGAEALAF